MSLTLGEDNAQALADIHAQLSTYNIGLIGASTSVYANRIGGFAGAVQNYQDALMQYRHVTKTNPAAKALAKQKASRAFQHMQMRFRHELFVVSAGNKAKKGTPLTSATRGTNIARSSRNTVKLELSSRIQTNE